MKFFSLGKFLKCCVCLILGFVAFHAVMFMRIDPFHRARGQVYTKSVTSSSETKDKSNQQLIFEKEKHQREESVTYGENEDTKTVILKKVSSEDKFKNKNRKEKPESESGNTETGNAEKETGTRFSTTRSFVSSNEKRGTDTGKTELGTSAVSSSSSNRTYDGHDLLKDPTFTFDKRFKNPCWYDGEELKCLPYFFVIGAKKCGTSTVFRRTHQFPQVISPGFKEAQFFARRRFAGHGLNDDIQLYIKKFAKAARYFEHKSTIDGYFKTNTKNPFITGEGSPSNLHLNSHWMNLPGNENLSEPKYVILDYIKHFVPDAKIIITFRDPIERLYSDYYHEFGSLRHYKDVGPEHFHEIVEEGIRLYRDCFSQRTVRSCVYDPQFYNITKIQIQLGIFYIFWEELLHVFSREQILVLQNQDLSSAVSYRQIQYFLGLDPLSDEQLEVLASSKPAYQRNDEYVKRGPMFNETFALLYKFYKPFNEKMAALTKDERFLYSHDIV